jgi:ferritin-like metal-binding protein YciE
MAFTVQRAAVEAYDMAAIASLRAHLIEELQDLLDAEQQLIEALPQMAQRAANRQLQSAFRSHLAQTRSHHKRVAQALGQLGEKPAGKTCEAMKGLLEEGQELMDGSETGALRDAMMITAAQKVEHYEIATYGTVRTYAQVLGERDVARLLAQTLKEEKAADRKLTGIAEGSINARASKEWHEHATATATGVLNRSAEWLGSTVGRAAKSVMPRSRAADRGSRSAAGSHSSTPSRSRASKRTRSNGSARRTRTATRR